MSSTRTKRDQFNQLSVLIGLNFVDMLGSLIVIPLLPFYALHFHATPETVGWLIASFSIAQLVAAPLWGRVSDRYGRRPALLIGLLASSMAFLVFGLADSLWLLFLSRVVQGLGGGTTGVAQAYVSDTVEREHRARALGWLSAATNAGVIIGPGIASLSTHWGSQAPGFVASALCFVNVVAAWIWLPESRPASARVASTTKRPPVWHAAANVFLNPAGEAERLIWVYGVGMLAFSLLTAVLALWLNARFGVTEKTIGFFFMYYGGLSFVMRSVFLGPVVDRIGEVGALRVGTILLAVGMLLYPLVPTVWLMAVVIPFVPIGTALMFPAITSLLSHSVDSSELGTMMGVAQTFAGSARVLAPILGTIAFQRLGVSSPFILGGFIVAMVSWVTFRHIRIVAAPAESVV
ncbi:MAG TPA: MFS transporter [Gemmatimonadales bacterium]|jgi:multidrug resistance protein